MTSTLKLRRSPSRPTCRRRSRGSVLMIVVVLLLLASLFVLFALNVGRFEQQTSGNDLRAKLAQEAAEAGLHQGVEQFNANRLLFSDPANWTLCDAGDTSFPCGAVAADRRGGMYRFAGGTSTGGRLITLGHPLTAVGGSPAQQQVSAVLCRVGALQVVGGVSVVPCVAPDDSTSTFAMTVVSRGTLTGEGASATVVQTIGGFNIFNVTPGIPPVIASGSVAVGGGLQIVSAPNAGGLGVPVSVWTRLAMTKNGTPNTCYLEEFLREGGSSSGPQYYQDIMVCDTCKCPGDGSLSFPKSGNEACQGMDIVDIDNNEANSPGCPVAPNLDIRRSEFPRDLFAFIFGQRGWDDLIQASGGESGDTFANREFNFAETRRISPCTFPHPVTKAPTTATLPDDTCYLLNIEKKIHIGDGVNDAAECAALGPSTQGLVWVHSQNLGTAGMVGFDCSVKIRGVEIGTPSAPVALVYDGSLTQVNGMKLFGLLFIREPNGSTLLDKDTGGSANFGINGNANIYGAVVVQGQVTSGGGGTAAIVYNSDVLINLFNNPANISFTSLPGSWTDRLRY